MDFADLLKRAVDAGVITKSGSHHKFGDVNLGNGEANAVAFLKDKDNAAVVADITAKLAPDAGATGNGGAPQPPTPPVPGRKPDGKPKSFKVVSTLRHDGEQYEPGSEVELTRKQYDALRNTGAIEGDW